jgi:hypothetical protein
LSHTPRSLSTSGAREAYFPTRDVYHVHCLPCATLSSIRRETKDTSPPRVTSSLGEQVGADVPTGLAARDARASVSDAKKGGLQSVKRRG